MMPELENARVTELLVRMDCNGCASKIKRAVHGVEGVYDVQVDLPAQKLIVLGRAETENIMRAIKKIRKVATIFSPGEATDDTTPPPMEQQAPELTPAPEPLPEAPAAEPPNEAPPPEAAANGQSEPIAVSEGKDVGEFPMMHHYPHGYDHLYHTHRDHWNFNYHDRNEGPFHVVTHSYNNHTPSTRVLEYAYGMDQSPQEYHRIVRFPENNYYDHRGRIDGGGSNGNQIDSMFSDENPNACTIV